MKILIMAIHTYMPDGIFSNQKYQFGKTFEGP
jgi:hypothetical protein